MTFAAEAVDPTVFITNGVTAAVVVGLLLAGWLWSKPAVDREFAKQAQMQALIDTLLSVYHHEVLPTLGDIDRRLMPLMERIERELDQRDRVRDAERDRLLDDIRQSRDRAREGERP